MNAEIYILAAGDKEEWCKEFGSDYKALLPWGKSTIIQTMVNNIRKELSIPINVIGRTEWNIDWLEGAKLIKIHSSSITETIASIQSNSEYILLLTGDSPLVTGKDLIPFLDKPADLVAGIIYKEDFEQMFPGWRKTFIKTADGNIKLAGAALISHNKWDTIVKEGTQYYQYRKNPLKIVRKMGLSLLLKLILGRLTISDVIQWAHKKFNVYAKTARVNPTLGADVDSKNDYVMLKIMETIGREKR